MFRALLPSAVVHVAISIRCSALAMWHAVFPFTDVGGSIRSCPSSSAIRQAVFVFTDVLVFIRMSPSALTMRNTIANELEEPRVNYIAGISAAFVLNSLRLKPLQKTPTIELEEVVSYRHYIPLEMRREDIEPAR